jgi:hypothetical protein
MFECLYCGNLHSADQSSEEHAIPQSLGGSFAPDRFKLKNVGRKCNNDLGQFVDASFTKSWFVSNELAMAAHKLYVGMDDFPLPLTCLGQMDVPGIQMPDGYTSEFWVGPSGETVAWLRPHDEVLYWYVGGDPRRRKMPSTVYWFPTSDDMSRLKMGLQSLGAAFKRRKKTRKIIGVQCQGFPGNGYPHGFDVPTELDTCNIAAIRESMPKFGGRMAVNVEFDYRFIAKFSLGVGYGIFGEAFLSTDHAKEFRKGCWPRNYDLIQMRGAPSFGGVAPFDPFGREFLGYPGAVVITVMLAGDSYVLSLTVNEGRPFVVSLAPATLQTSLVNSLNGYSLLLFPSMRHSIETTLVGLIAHRNKSYKNHALTAIDERLERSKAFWCGLAPLPKRPGG